MKTIVSLSIAFVLFIIVCLSCCTRIDSGHEGILVEQYGSGKGVQDVALVTGRVWYNPITQSVFEFPTYVQTADYDTFTVNAKDGSIFQIDPMVSFHIIAGKTPEIFRKYRKDIDEIKNSVLLNYVKDAFKNVFNTYTTDSILSKREQFDAQVTQLLTKELTEEGFAIDQLTFGMFYPKPITEAIDKKNKSKQEELQKRNDLMVAKQDSAIAIVKASAEAFANKLRQQTLTTLLIQQQFIEKWDGKTPLYGTSPMLLQNIQK